jgi:L-alanine-DL-glutamate epimerase-like enolase superfamily enzyme
MRITDVKIFPVADFVYVKILTDQGVHGIGEASLSGRSGAVVAALEDIKPLLVGQDASRIEFIWQDIFRGNFWRGGPVLQSALAGVDIALWDLAGKALGVPTYRLLGGAARDKVLVYRHVSGTSPEALGENVLRLWEEGWKVARISPIDMVNGDSFIGSRAVRSGVEYFEGLRKVAGDEPEVIFEVHTRLTPPHSIELCNAIAQYRPFFVEDPIRSENPQSFANLRAHTSVPIGTGEQFHTKWAFRELIEGELIDYLRVDICHTGGITEGKKIAAWGEVHYQELACHYTGSPVSSAAMLHLNMAVPNCAVQEHAPHEGPLNEVIEHDIKAVDGYLPCPTAPGLGIDLNEEAAVAFGHGSSEPPHWRRADGSVQDW